MIEDETGGKRNSFQGFRLGRGRHSGSSRERIHPSPGEGQMTDYEIQRASRNPNPLEAMIENESNGLCGNAVHDENGDFGICGHPAVYEMNKGTLGGGKFCDYHGEIIKKILENND